MKKKLLLIIDKELLTSFNEVCDSSMSEVLLELIKNYIKDKNKEKESRKNIRKNIK